MGRWWFLFFVLPACGNYSTVVRKYSPGTVSYAMVRDQIFTPRCIGCHGSSGGVNLETYSGVKSVEARIDQTVYVKKTMPKSGGPLSTEQLGMLRVWLDDGSPDVVARVPYPTY